MFAKVLTHAGHTRGFSISDLGHDGWEVRIEQDSAVIRQLCYTDWHRVERALGAMALEVKSLEESGWRECAAR